MNTKTATGVNRTRRVSGIPGADVPFLPSASVVVLTIEYADRKLETLAHEALTVLGQMMGYAEDDTVKLRAASIVLLSCDQHQRCNI